MISKELCGIDMKYYISFGWGHEHKLERPQYRDTNNDIILDKNCLFEIEADSYDKAYKKAEKLFGTKWSMIYDNIGPADIRDYFPQGIIKDES